MSEQTGALAALRRAIERVVETEYDLGGLDQAANDGRFVTSDEVAGGQGKADAAQAALDAALAEVDARLDRLARFVRAHDAHEHAIADPEPPHVWIAILVELRAARDALAPEDLVPGGNGHQPR